MRVKDFEPLVTEVSRFATLSALPRMTGSPAHAHDLSAKRPASAAADVAVSNAPVVHRRPGGDRTSRRASAIDTADRRRERRHLQHAPERAVAGALAPAREASVRIARAGRQRGAAPEPDRSARASSAFSALSVGFLVLSTRRAQDLARQQLEFVATVSHELRTPLAVIRSAADNLADGVVNDEARIRQYGQLVRREGLRLTDLVEQILEFAGLQSGQRTMTAGPVEIGKLLREVVATAEATAARGGQRSSSRSPTTCRPSPATSRRCAASSRTWSATRSSTARMRAGSA